MTIRLSDNGWRDPCEWDPRQNRLNAGIQAKDGTWMCMQGCRNSADVVLIGSDLRLCDSCAKLPRFARFRKRTRIRSGVEEKS